MLMSFALALAIQQDIDQDIARIMQLPESAATYEASVEWSDCLDSSRDRFEPSGEPASAIATAALFSCQTQFGILFQTIVARTMATQPDAIESEVRRAQIERSADQFRTQEWRITHDVVVLRLARRQ